MSIKPVLEGFVITPDAAGVVQAGEHAQTATILIQGLSRAFLPSLVALVLTVLVAFARGFYTHRRGVLAGELDRLDLEHLFRRFPPPSLSRAFDEARSQLADLTSQMLASQRNLDGFVERLSGAAKGFRADAPPLKDASVRFVDATEKLGPRMDALTAALIDHLGPASPLVTQLATLDGISEEVKTAAAHMNMAGAIISKHLQQSHLLLRETADALPSRLAEACRSAGAVLGEVTASAVATASRDVTRALEVATEPLCASASNIAIADEALRSHIKLAIDELSNDVSELTRSVQEETTAGNQSTRSHINEALEALASSVATRIDEIEKNILQSLDSAVENIGHLHTSTSEATENIALSIIQLEEIEQRLGEALRESVSVHQNMGQMSEATQAATTQIAALARQIDSATAALTDVHNTNVGMTQRLSELATAFSEVAAESDDLRGAMEGLVLSQGASTQKIESLVNRADQVSVDWRQWLDEATQQANNGRAFNENFYRIVEEGAHVAHQLSSALGEAQRLQEPLKEQLATLNTVLGRIEHVRGPGFFERIFRNKP